VARRRVYEELNGKTEAWHILWTAPDATILAGVKPGLARDDVFRAFKEQDYDRVMPRYPIKAGDTVYVPGGVIHAFGPDTLIFEVQQTSDLTQSVMSTDMYGGRLDEMTWDARISATLDELRATDLLRPHPGLTRRVGAHCYAIGAAGAHFALERWTLTEPHVELAHARRCMTLSNVGDPVQLAYGGGTETLGRAESCILPAAIGEVRVMPGREGSLIACYIPDLARDIVAPLRAAGHMDDAIRMLGAVNP